MLSRADGLLQLAGHLASLPADKYGQTHLSRAISTAYYALFHLLIDDATSNWRQEALRAALGRVFEHGRMRSACEASVNELKTYFAGNPPTSREQAIAIHLHVVADTFVQIQHQRNEADYNVSKDWKPTEVVSLVSSVAVAFRSWKIVRGEPAAQALLVAMLGGRDRREGPRTGTRTKPIPPIPSEDSLPVE